MKYTEKKRMEETRSIIKYTKIINAWITLSYKVLQHVENEKERIKESTARRKRKIRKNRSRRRRS